MRVRQRIVVDGDPLDRYVFRLNDAEAAALKTMEIGLEEEKNVSCKRPTRKKVHRHGVVPG